MFALAGMEFIAVDLPRITVVTPSYNQGRFLDHTIRSVLDQDYSNLEYIICDGGSTDDSLDIIKKYDHRLAYWSSGKDKGQTDALNKGMARATGDLLTFINSDDTLYPGSLMAAANAFREGHEWIIGWAMFLEPGGEEWPQLPEAYLRHTDWFACNPISQQGSFWSARLWREVGPFREDMHFGFDYEFWMRFVFKAKATPHLIRKCMGGYRLHESSKTMSQYDKFLIEFKRVRDQFWSELTPDEQQTVLTRRKRREFERHQMAGWNAMKKGDITAAREHAKEALRRNKSSPESWKLLYCALRGR